MRQALRAVVLVELLAMAIYFAQPAHPAKASHPIGRHLYTTHFSGDSHRELVCLSNSIFNQTEHQSMIDGIMNVLLSPSGWQSTLANTDKKIDFYQWVEPDVFHRLPCEALNADQRAITTVVFKMWNDTHAMCDGPLGAPVRMPVACVTYVSTSSIGNHYGVPFGIWNGLQWGTWRDYGQTEVGVGKYSLDNLMQSKGTDQFKSIINHEVGHSLGLADPNTLPGPIWCNGWTSVMHSSGYTCTTDYSWPTHSDKVAVANIITSGGIPATPSGPPPAEPPSGYTGPTHTPTPTVIPFANLGLTPGVRPGSNIAAGFPATFDLHVWNVATTNSVTATNVSLTTKLPFGVAYSGFVYAVGPQNTGPCTYNAAERAFSCVIPNLAPNAYVWVQLQVITAIQGPLSLEFSISPGPGYRDVSGSNTGALNLSVTPVGCNPRPPAIVQTQALGDRLRVTVQAGVQTGNPISNPPNHLEGIRFGVGRNAIVEMADRPPVTGDAFVSFGDNRIATTFDIRRASPGQDTIVHLEVQDHCGTPWKTFVGGGTLAGF